MDTDQALQIATIVGLALICFCGIAASCHKMRVPTQGGGMKESRSDNDLTTILDNAIPSASASRRSTDDPMYDSP